MILSRKLLLVVAVSFFITAPLWARVGAELDHAFRANAQDGIAGPCGGIGVACTTPAPTIQLTTPTSGGIIDVGQAFGPAIGPYVNSILHSLIFFGVTWLGIFLKTRFNINVDESQRATLTTFLQNQAASLIADGVVKMVGTKIQVEPAALDAAANHAANVIPDALAHFELDGQKGIEPLKAKIIDAIPLTQAGAAIVAQAHLPQAT
jgi:hypothetical protein